MWRLGENLRGAGRYGRGGAWRRNASLGNAKRRFSKASPAWTNLPPRSQKAPGLRWLERGLSASPFLLADGRVKLHPQLRRLSSEDWLLYEPNRYTQDMLLKQQLFDGPWRSSVLVDGNALDAQQEVYDLVQTHLSQRFPAAFPAGDTADAAMSTPCRDAAMSPLERAARLCQEDLMILRQRPDGEAGDYNLVAAACCFSFGDVRQRAGNGHSMRQLHANVDGFEDDLGNAVRRAMHGLKTASPMWRTNWGLSASNTLGPHESDEHTDAVRGRISERGVASLGCTVEYQTLRRLVRNPDCILFTVHTYKEPFATFTPNAALQLAQNVRAAAMHAIRSYKGLDDACVTDKILAFLDERAAEGNLDSGGGTGAS
ncbi:hypothetical protein M885DRAFT_530071 [Pelagophyceae sp. CCMP2097]|nr:hypothetical protein M885DRAFT_530071 [Pelagophyceae sp. CCMP2097]